MGSMIGSNQDRVGRLGMEILLWLLTAIWSLLAKLLKYIQNTNQRRKSPTVSIAERSISFKNTSF